MTTSKVKSQLKRKLSFFISDCNEVYLAGLVSTANNFPNVKEVCSARNFSEVITINRELYFNLFLIDIDMPGFDSCKFILRLKEKNLNAKIILLSSIDDISQIKKQFKLGATGYLNKNSPIKEIYSAIKEVLQGNLYVTGHIKEIIIQNSIGATNHHSLNKLDIDVMYLIAHQFSNKEITKCLEISEKAIEYHRLNVFKSLGIRNMVGIGVYAVRNNIYFNSTLNRRFSKFILSTTNSIYL